MPLCLSLADYVRLFFPNLEILLKVLLLGTLRIHAQDNSIWLDTCTKCCAKTTELYIIGEDDLWFWLEQPREVINEFISAGVVEHSKPPSNTLFIRLNIKETVFRFDSVALEAHLDPLSHVNTRIARQLHSNLVKVETVTVLSKHDRPVWLLPVASIVNEDEECAWIAFSPRFGLAFQHGLQRAFDSRNRVDIACNDGVKVHSFLQEAPHLLPLRRITQHNRYLFLCQIIGSLQRQFLIASFEDRRSVAPVFANARHIKETRHWGLDEARGQW